MKLTSFHIPLKLLYSQLINNITSTLRLLAAAGAADGDAEHPESQEGSQGAEGLAHMSGTYDDHLR